MREVVVIIGPTVVIGAGTGDSEMAAMALACIDDDLALVEDQAVPVDELWRKVLESTVAGPCTSLVLIFPSWWAQSRVDRVSAAADGRSANVTVLRRAEVPTTVSAVVEVAPELVVVQADSQRHVFARVNASERVVDAIDAIVACVDGLSAVTVHVPAGVARFGTELARALRCRSVEVTVVDDRTLIDVVRGARGDIDGAATARRRRPSPRAAAAAAAVLSVSALVAAAVGLDAGTADSLDAVWLVEGRVAVEIPVRWTVEQITSGPGSARIQVVSPWDRAEAIHVTQSQVPDALTLDAVAETLRGALAEQPEGVFVDFTALGERAHRAAVTYREIRADRHIDWTVLLDDGVRIAIGCQVPAGRAGPRQMCDRAVHSAHAIARK